MCVCVCMHSRKMCWAKWNLRGWKQEETQGANLKKKHEESDDDELCWRKEEEGTRKTTTTLFVCSRIHILEWEKAYNMIFSYVLLRLVIIIFTHMLHFSASNKTVVNLEKVSRFNINSNQCALLKQFFSIFTCNITYCTKEEN